ncbi:hypothetical protein DB88DRAFT_119811 [Papiliotrema laurentii]|uniref:Uncharacterized protein n=1 Tax=Papiliotrema laurentii TaxID=5418 RepID=A0AAD9FN75_PAPLA|nr:hypothetical protein DB88DRAFT_119811 [Papiliotrema laurentii]
MVMTRSGSARRLSVRQGRHATGQSALTECHAALLQSICRPSQVRKLKLAVFRDVILYYLKGDHQRYTDLMDDLHSHRVAKFSLSHRLQRAKDGKEAANQKYKDGSIVPAMYTYAIAWGILLPYFPEHYPAEDPTRADLGAIECALFSNISAMAAMEVRNDTLTQDQIEIISQIGMDAAEVCISAREFVSVGIMVKSCRRARELAEKARSREVPKDKLRFFKEQEDLLAGLPSTTMFSRVPAKHIARPVQL